MAKLNRVVFVVSVFVLVSISGLAAMLTRGSTLAPVAESVDLSISDLAGEAELSENFVLFPSNSDINYDASDEEEEIAESRKGKEIAAFETEEKCFICLDNISSKRKKLFNCGHQFHKECINSWMNAGSKNSSRCPACRGKISLIDYIRKRSESNASTSAQARVPRRKVLRSRMQTRPRNPRGRTLLVPPNTTETPPVLTGIQSSPPRSRRFHEQLQNLPTVAHGLPMLQTSTRRPRATFCAGCWPWSVDRVTSP